MGEYLEPTWTKEIWTLLFSLVAWVAIVGLCLVLSRLPCRNGRKKVHEESKVGDSGIHESMTKFELAATSFLIDEIDEL